MVAHKPPQKKPESLSDAAGAEQGFTIQVVQNIAMTDFTDLESLLSAASYPDCPPPHQSIRSLGQTPAPRFQSENASPLREWRVNVSRKPRENTSGVSQRSSIQQTKRQPVASSIKGDASAAVNSTDDRKKEVSIMLRTLSLVCHLFD